MSKRQWSTIKWLAPILVGWLFLYGPIYTTLWNTLWQTEEYSFAPVIGLISIVLLLLSVCHDHASSQPNYAFGICFFMTGCAFAILGYAYNIPFIALLSQPLTLTGIILLTNGVSALKHYLFPVVFLLFMVPIPGFILETLTYSLKESLSQLTVSLLYFLGYPIANIGVIIQIGQYQLLVADACSGLHSLISFIALGLVYLYLNPASRITSIMMILFIVPIALAGNFIRIILMALITYHLGDIAGNYIHDYMGLLLFFITGGLLITIRHGLDYLFGPRGLAI